MSESEEQGFEVSDKRRVKLDEDGNVQVNETAEIAREQAETAEGIPGPGEADLPPVDVYSMLRYFIGMLNAHAWQWMGLWANPVTGKVDRDLSQAKVAIDSISALVKQLEGKMDFAEERELRSMLSDLQINFVQQSAKQG